MCRGWSGSWRVTAVCCDTFPRWCIDPFLPEARRGGVELTTKCVAAICLVILRFCCRGGTHPCLSNSQSSWLYVGRSQSKPQLRAVMGMFGYRMRFCMVGKQKLGTSRCVLTGCPGLHPQAKHANASEANDRSWSTHTTHTHKAHTHMTARLPSAEGGFSNKGCIHR